MSQCWPECSFIGVYCHIYWLQRWWWWVRWLSVCLVLYISSTCFGMMPFCMRFSCWVGLVRSAYQWVFRGRCFLPHMVCMPAWCLWLRWGFSLRRLPIELHTVFIWMQIASRHVYWMLQRASFSRCKWGWQLIQCAKTRRAVPCPDTHQKPWRHCASSSCLCRARQ